MKKMSKKEAEEWCKRYNRAGISKSAYPERICNACKVKQVELH